MAKIQARYRTVADGFPCAAASARSTAAATVISRAPAHPSRRPVNRFGAARSGRARRVETPCLSPPRARVFSIGDAIGNIPPVVRTAGTAPFRDWTCFYGYITVFIYLERTNSSPRPKP